MSIDAQKKPSSIEQLVSTLKQVLTADEPTEEKLAELGESLLNAVKSALSGKTS